MTEKRFTYGETIDYNFFDVFEEKKYLGMIQRDSTKIVDKLNEQQDTISALKDIFKGIITYSEWDSKKPYCSLGIAVDRKTYYKIRKILNE